MKDDFNFRPFRAYTRGWRNNNPLNIRYVSANDWVGRLKRLIKRDKDFEEFYYVFFGYRAALMLLLRYFYVNNLRTPMKIVSRWAPPNENETKLYALKVVSVLNHRKSEGWENHHIAEAVPSPFKDAGYWVDFVEGMTLVESGKMPDDDDEHTKMRGAISKAFKALLETKTVKAWRMKYEKS